MFRHVHVNNCAPLALDVAYNRMHVYAYMCLCMRAVCMHGKCILLCVHACVNSCAECCICVWHVRICTHVYVCAGVCVLVVALGFEDACMCVSVCVCVCVLSLIHI